MNSFSDIAKGVNPNYTGLLLGLCKKCGGHPTVQRSKYVGTFRAKCTRCTNMTLDYGSMGHCIEAWNSKNTVSLAEEIKKTKEGR